MKKYTLNKEFVLQFNKDKVTIFNPENSYLYTLNKTATLIVVFLDEGLTIELLIKKILEEYNIDFIEAEREVLETIDYLLAEKIIK